MNSDSPAPAPSARDVFLRALEEPENARLSFVAGACGDDDALRARVEALLRSHREDSFLEMPAVVLPEAPAHATAAPGTMIGRYRLLEKIGEGGCGTVHLAEQSEPVRRQVALKLIKAGLDTDGFIARFEAERQALALMDHPGIARVFDAGATETGRPFLMMELVRGPRITEFCAAHHLSIRARLELFMQVCHAVQHAHQKGVIHRDLKPSNILVATHDGRPLPKVIDFGIAKATGGERLTDRTNLTVRDQFLGTPAYMSPEQAGTDARDVDTRSDIYSLGVLLYELLTGTPPFEEKELLERGLEGMRQIIRDREPPKPSTRLASGAEPKTRNPKLETSEHVRAVRGDLDWIVMKALEKERGRRYESAGALADDIQRHLRHEPVLAGPPSRIYRVRKLARRHRAAFAAGTVVAVGLVTGLIVAGWGLRKEHAARLRAEDAERTATTASKKSEQVAGILRTMLAGAQPEVALGRDITLLRQIIDATATNIARDTAGQPEVEAEVRSTLGSVYFSLGEFPKAEAQFRIALALRQKLFGAEHRLVAESMHLLGGALYNQRQPVEAETLFRQSLDQRRKLIGPESKEVTQTLNNLGLTLAFQRRVEEGEKLQREALALGEKVFGSNHVEVAAMRHDLASTLYGQRKHAEAETHTRVALAIFEQAHGRRHPTVVTVQHTLAALLQKLGRLDETEQLLRETLTVKRELYGRDHAETGATVRNLAMHLRQRGRMAEAEPLYREALVSARRGGVFSGRDLENCIYDVGAAVLDRAWVEHESAPAPSTNRTAQAREAAELFREYLALHARSTGTNDAPTANVRSHLAAALTLEAATDISLSIESRTTLFTEAEVLLLAALPRLEASSSMPALLKRKTLLHLAWLYESSGQPREAAEWRAKYQAAEKAATPAPTP